VTLKVVCAGLARTGTVSHLLQFDREGKRTPTELFGVSRATIYRELKKAQEAAA
jgi:hypothetical protein